jgi:hypothetical protein
MHFQCDLPQDLVSLLQVLRSEDPRQGDDQPLY